MTKMILNVDQASEKINRNIYGHFAEHLGRCIYEGIWVGEDSPIPNTNGIRNDVVEALKKINIPVLRWPGGCFADEYHWKDGIGPREKRKRIVNTHWGGVVENNHFGTHEFMELCKQLETEPYICGNVGSGTVYEMQQWVEYVTFAGESPMSNWRKENGRKEAWPLKYFGVGNENWGCGGKMEPEYYADVYRRYQTYVRNYGDNKIFKIACGPHNDDYHWTEVMMDKAKDLMDGLSLHYYTSPGGRVDSATEFGEELYFEAMKRTLFMEELVTKHSTIMDKYDPEKEVALIVDEWGTWYGVEPGTNPRFLYQQNSLRDALVAGLNLNIFNNHCDRVKMANIAQTVNVLQAMILTDGEKMILTPSYHVFEMFKVHQDATMIPLNLDKGSYEYNGESVPEVSASASIDTEGRINVTLCNVNPNDSVEVDCKLNGFSGKEFTGRVLTDSSMTAHNTFTEPENVKPAAFEQVKLTENGFSTTMPAKSVVVITLM